MPRIKKDKKIDKSLFLKEVVSETGLSKEQAKSVFKAMLNIITKHTMSGHKVHTILGGFSMTERKRTGEAKGKFGGAKKSYYMTLGCSRAVKKILNSHF